MVSLSRIRCEVTYDFLENIDLVEEHAFFIFVHVTLSEDFDGALSL